jgi:hypothetical protein
MEIDREFMFGRLLLSEDLAPVPLPESWGTMLVSAQEPEQIVELCENQLSFGSSGGMPEVRAEKTFRARRAAVASSYAAEYDRVLSYVRSLAREITVVTSYPPALELPGVDFATQVADSGVQPPRAGSRLPRLLAEAVRASGKPVNPRGARILDLEHWLGVADRYFSRLTSGAEHLAISSVFVPALTEWLRVSAVAAGVRRRMIHARIGLPAERQAFTAAAARLTLDVHEAADQLGLAFERTSLAAYRDGARVVLGLQEAYPQGVGSVGLDLVFRERRTGDPCTVPAIGLAIPPPPDGYPLLVEDGRTEMLPRPPWQMGTIWR